MLWYLILLIIIIFVLVLEQFRIKNKATVVFGFTVIIVILLALFSASRDGFGADYNSYSSYFDMYKSGYIVKFEPGYLFLEEVTHQLGLGFQFIVIICALVYMFCVMRLFFAYSTSVIFSIFLFFCFTENYISSLSFIRQSLAAGILVFAFISIVKNRKGYFLFFITLATMFHYSSLVFLSLFFIYKIKIRSYFLLLPLIVYVFGSLLTLDVYILNITAQSGMYQHFDKLLLNDSEANGYGFLVSYLVFLILSYKYTKINLSTVNSLLLKATVLYYLFIALSIHYPPFSRLALLFSLYPCVLIPGLIEKYNIVDKQKFILKIALVFLYSILAARFFMNTSFVRDYGNVAFFFGDIF